MHTHTLSWFHTDVQRATLLWEQGHFLIRLRINSIWMILPDSQSSNGKNTNLKSLPTPPPPDEVESSGAEHAPTSPWKQAWRATAKSQPKQLQEAMLCEPPFRSPPPVLALLTDSRHSEQSTYYLLLGTMRMARSQLYLDFLVLSNKPREQGRHLPNGCEQMEEAPSFPYKPLLE